MEMKFYRCKVCGQIIAIVKQTKVPLMCCGKMMEEIIPGEVDASAEKHVPVWEVKDGVVEVKVGSIEHPMIEEHYIEWIALQTKKGNQRVKLSPNDAPVAHFAILPGDEVLAVYAYCNLHSLFKG